MHAVRSGIGEIDEKPGGQLALDVDVVLPYVSVLGVSVRRQGRRTVCRDECREVGLRIASGRQKDTLRAERTSRIGTREAGKSGARERAIRTVQRAERG